MSRIGKKLISIPNNVVVTVEPEKFLVKGPKGSLEQRYIPLITISIDKNIIQIQRKNDSKQAKSLHGLYNKLMQNMIAGVSSGFEKVLLISGVGYRAELNGKELLLNLGYSNSISYMIPDGVEVQVENQVKILLKAIDKVLIGQIAAEIRSLRPVEPYKGKGIYYENEHVRRKEGKAGIK